MPQLTLRRNRERVGACIPCHRNRGRAACEQATAKPTNNPLHSGVDVRVSGVIDEVKEMLQSGCSARMSGSLSKKSKQRGKTILCPAARMNHEKTSDAGM